jgi:chitinase
VADTVIFLEEWGFDGLDLDYEYPVDVGGVLTDKAGFTAWVRELRAAFQPKGWELTAAVSANATKVDTGYEVSEISEMLDAIHLMTYDLHGSWENQVGHHATLHGAAGDLLTIDYA